MGITANQVRRKALSVLCLLSVVFLLSSCRRLRALAGDPSAQQTTPPPTRIQGIGSDGQEVNITPGPPSTPAAQSQGWHITPLKCSADEKLLGMCGGSLVPSSHGSAYVPNYSTPQPPAYHFHYSTKSRSHY